MRRTATLATALVASLALLGAPVQAADELPVTYNFLVSAVTSGTNVDADPPGANDWNCKPSAAHPRPVVLVHGTAGNKNTNWQTYAPLLKNNGYCVFALTYGIPEDAPPVTDQLGGMNRMQDSARQLKAFVAKVLNRTGARKVDLVGHSQGTLMPDYWLKFLGGAPYVKHYVSLAPLWHGTDIASQSVLLSQVFGFPEQEMPWCAACTQMGTGSAFMKKMREGGVAVDGVVYTNIMTKHDELVQPYSSGREPGMRNLVVQDFCATDYSEHFEIAADPVGSVLVLNALDPAHKRPVPCMVVLPFIGPVG